MTISLCAEPNVLTPCTLPRSSMPYFFSQDPDYVTVKEAVANQCANGVEAEGIATIDTGIETLRVAEYLKPLLAEQLGN